MCFLPLPHENSIPSSNRQNWHLNVAIVSSLAMQSLSSKLALPIIPEDSADLVSDLSSETSELPPYKPPCSTHSHQSITEAITSSHSVRSLVEVAEENWLKDKSEVVRKENCSCACVIC